jgi:hypothetical protein
MIGTAQVSKICKLPWNDTADQNLNLHHRENLICDKIFINLQYKSTLSLFNQIFSATSEVNRCPCPVRITMRQFRETDLDIK